MLEKNRLFLAMDLRNEVHLIYVKYAIPAYALVTPDISKKVTKEEFEIRGTILRLANLLKIKLKNVHIIQQPFARIAAKWFCHRNKLIMIEDASRILNKEFPLKRHLFLHLKNTIEQFKESFRNEQLGMRG